MMKKEVLLFVILQGGRKPTADMLLDGVCGSRVYWI